MLKSNRSLATLLLVVICPSVAISIAVRFRPDISEFGSATFGDRFQGFNDYRLPRNYEVLTDVDTFGISEGPSNYGIRFVVARIGQITAKRWHKVGPPWSDGWKNGFRDNNSWLPLPRDSDFVWGRFFRDIEHYSYYFSREGSDIQSDSFYFDYRTGTTSYEVLLLFVDDGIVCYFFSSL